MLRQVTDKGKDGGDRNLRHAERRIAFDIANGNAMPSAISQINIIIAGSGHTNEAQIWSRRKILRMELDLVDDDNIAVLQAIGHVFGRSIGINFGFSHRGKGGQIQILSQGGTVKHRNGSHK